MKLNRAPRNPHSETIIALIDVVFFLLVFFMLIGRMDATAPFEVSPPIASSGRDMPAGGATLAIGIDGKVSLDGALIERQSLNAAFATLLANDSNVRLRINAHRAVELRHVLPLVGQAETAGFQTVVLVVTPESQQKRP